MYCTECAANLCISEACDTDIQLHLEAGTSDARRTAHSVHVALLCLLHVHLLPHSCIRITLLSKP